MPEWKPGKTPTKTVGPFEVFYLTSKTSGEGGHEIRFPDGRSIRVLPDLTTSGQKRSRAITEALTKICALHDRLERIETVAYLYGSLIVVGCTNVEIVDPNTATVCETCGQALPEDEF